MAQHSFGAKTAADPLLVPPVLVTWLSVFRSHFKAPAWNRVLVLVAGAVLAPGKRTVTQALRVMGLDEEPVPWAARQWAEQPKGSAREACGMAAEGCRS